MMELLKNLKKAYIEQYKKGKEIKKLIEKLKEKLIDEFECIDVEVNFLVEENKIKLRLYNYVYDEHTFKEMIKQMDNTGFEFIGVSCDDYKDREKLVVLIFEEKVMRE